MNPFGSLVLSAALLVSASAVAQTNQGVGPDTKDPKSIEVPESGSLPAAGQAGPSASPAMALDCQKNPRDCSEPVKQTGSTPASPGIPQQSK